MQQEQYEKMLSETERIYGEESFINRVARRFPEKLRANRVAGGIARGKQLHEAKLAREAARKLQEIEL
jgi:hypothetical protein